ncbi:uncharacterized protein LOC103511511 [Diaphorina citri]|uniref:Uncharacterized protein LOC103511511 n=1 Tax=Diaphorina citri TaxID=121845 RepID=A0A1S3D6C5_DIACI|nr:uncharacterized protein LOC103511511 [Diaphorina citri]XP_026681058.1 uncharacterized protein LOC103511511 [Diaphorina citri]XP_026681059.1 uncharacterized protein LOC103511511 [Diaphorina citri]
MAAMTEDNAMDLDSPTDHSQEMEASSHPSHRDSDSESSSEEIPNRTSLRQSNDYLDDPSQFYFDDDIPTPDELSTGSGNSNDIPDKHLNEDSNQAGKEFNEESIRRDSENQVDCDKDGQHSEGHKESDNENKENEDNDTVDGNDCNVPTSEAESEYASEDEEEEGGESPKKTKLRHDAKDLDSEEEVEEEEDFESAESGQGSEGRREKEEDTEKMGDEDGEEEEEGSIIMEEYEEESDEEEEEEVDENEEVEEEGDKEMSVGSDVKEAEEEGDDLEHDKESEEEFDNERENEEGTETLEDVEKDSQDRDNACDNKLEITSQEKENIESESGSKEKPQDVDDTPKTESEKGLLLLEIKPSSETVNMTDDVKELDNTNRPTEVKPNPDSHPGFQVSKDDIEKIKLKKDLLLSRISTLEKFLDATVKCKAWREGEEKEEERVETQLFQRRTRQRGVTEPETVTGKRKRSLDDSQEEVIVKRDGRGRPKGSLNKVKREVVESPSPKREIDAPIVKRKKKDEILLMKALDEEMFKMDEENNKEMERISQGLEYQCSVCSQVFIEKKNLSKHFFKCLMKFTQSGCSSFKCAICFEYFSLLESLEMHITRKHIGICEEPYQCSQCSLCFDQGSLLKAHVLEKHEVFQCTQCEKYYRSQSTLDVHVSKKHPAGTGKVKRDIKPNTNILTVTPNRRSARNDSTKATVKTETEVKVKIEPVADIPIKKENVGNEIVQVKKLGRPFKRKSSDVSTCDQDRTVKTEPNESAEANIEEDGLGRGRRVKKKKQLDYEDSISTLPGRRVRKSTDSVHTEGKTDVKEKMDYHTFVKVENKNEVDEPVYKSPVNHSQLVKPKPVLRDVDRPEKMDVRVDKCTLSKPTDNVVPIENLQPVDQGKKYLLQRDQATQKIEDTVEENGQDNTAETEPIQQTGDSVYLNRKVHLCPKCRKPFVNKFLVKVHMKRKHNIFKRKTVIQQSGPESTSGSVHRARPPASNREMLFKCALCEERFATFYSLEDHYLRAHDGIPCGVCKILIKNRMLLDKHLNACHGVEERHVCPVCDKRMKSKQTLRKHINVHEDRRPYDCVVCKRSFRYTYDMRLHMKRQHPKEWLTVLKTDVDAGDDRPPMSCES